MTPQDRLKEIEADFKTANPRYNSATMIKSDIEWLIARCKQLEESLGIIASDFATNYGNSIIAIEALNTMPEGDK